MMNVEQLAVFLHRDAREVQKWASRGYLPAHKVSGEYRFVAYSNNVVILGINGRVTLDASDIGYLGRHRTGAQFHQLPRAVREQALQRLGAWAATAFGSVDAVSCERHSFELQFYRLSGANVAPPLCLTPAGGGLGAARPLGRS